MLGLNWPFLINCFFVNPYPPPLPSLTISGKLKFELIYCMNNFIEKDSIRPGKAMAKKGIYPHKLQLNNNTIYPSLFKL